MSNEDIGRKAAERFRKEYSLGITPIANLAQLIEHTVGIGVAYVNSSSPGRGMTMQLGDMHLIAVGCTKHPMRLRSTLAHELGHHQLGSVDRMTDGGDWANRSPEEIQADAFARHLLVPMDGVSSMADGGAVTLATLSNIVQSYLASPRIVAIQMRDSGAIDSNTCNLWGQLSTSAIATRFGWLADYQALIERSSNPRGPQRLMTQAMEGYRQGTVSTATIAKLSGEPRAADIQLAHDEAMFTSPWISDVAAPAPKDTGARLTPEELRILTGGAA